MRAKPAAPVVYDTGALVAAERGVHRPWAHRDESLRLNIEPLVPVVVLAQAWRGGPQHNLSRFLKGCLVLPDVESMGRAAGAACAAAGTSDVVDALVVVTALHLHAVVVTADPDDLGHLAEALGTKLSMINV